MVKLALALGCLAAAAFGDIRLDYSVREEGGRGGAYTVKVFCRPQGMRLESTRPGNGHVLIYREDKKVFWRLDPAKGTYSEIPESKIADYRLRLNAMKMMLLERSAKIPEDRKKMLIGKLQARFDGPRLRSLVPMQPGSGETFQGLICLGYRQTIGSKKRIDAWFAPSAGLGIPRREFNDLTRMADGISSISSEAAEVLRFRVNGDTLAPDVPVIIRSENTRGSRTEVRLTSSRVLGSQSSPTLDLPPGLKLVPLAVH
ncbi:MAG TPA: hypothetical protein VJ385_03905 [Fibrobacteria bacterium]|nr:hypothetical protein [Fibrobacteria bacterium]